ncbi:hypothetical protein [Shewanella sp.]|jgi:hypothetical protein|uniref:hypothetical protein n=1 Tax=Shewanella sp. TaxID=50422 RepID=UPI004048E406
MNSTFQDFMADLNALVRQQPDTEIEAIIWLNSLMYNAHQAIENIQRNDLNKENFGGTD